MKGNLLSDTRLQDTSVRPDYLKHTKWTYGECAHFVQLKIQTIRRWAGGRINGRRRWLWANRKGALKVDAQTFQQFVKTNEPQGEAMPQGR